MEENSLNSLGHLIGSLVPFAVLGFFVYAIIKKNGLSEEEKGLTPVYFEKYCGGRFNTFNATIPFVRVFVYDRFVVISCLKRYVLKFDEIDAIEIKRHIFSKGVHFHHHNPDIPQVLIVWSLSPERLKDVILTKAPNIKENHSLY